LSTQIWRTSKVSKSIKIPNTKKASQPLKPPNFKPERLGPEEEDNPIINLVHKRNVILGMKSNPEE
jgi:hypothetical protein